MSEQPPNSLQEVRIHGEISDDPDELAAVADAVVRGCSICYARITSLRALIEAVQQHPDATLAPSRAERGDDWKPPKQLSPEALTTLDIYAGEILDGDCSSHDIRLTVQFMTRFAADALFHRADFAGDVRFNETHFVSLAYFWRTHFAGTAMFSSVYFANDAEFSKSRFAGTAWFRGTHFAGAAGFTSLYFGDETWFSETKFAEYAGFFDSHFAGEATFADIRFDREAAFQYTYFGGLAWFDETKFAGDARFDGTYFAGNAEFEETHFAGEADFDVAQFAGEVSGDMRACYLRTAEFAEQARRNLRPHQRALEQSQPEEDAPASKTSKTLRAQLAAIGDWLADLLQKSRWTEWMLRVPTALLVTVPGRVWRWITRDFGWRTVRALGQLQILNRVSVIALIAVPVLAALTGALQVQFPQWPGLGTSPALLFFAAVFVTLGLLAYQVWSAEDVRKYDEDEFIDRAHRRYPEEATDRDDGLRRSIENLEAIAKRRPDRHANFVAHHGDTIWIPPRDEIGWFEDWTRPPDSPDPPVSQDNEADDDRAGAGRDIASRETVESSEDRSAPEKAQQRGMVPGAERRRITIEEGAKAEYWLKSRERWPLAWVSFTLYLVGIVCLLDVLRRQAINVAEAAGWTFWPFG